MEIKDIVAGYGATEVLHGVSIRIDDGEIVTIIGPNGSGKSTIFKVIMGYIIPNDGHVYFQGRDISALRTDERVRMGINYVPQLENVFASLTVRENLEMGAYLLHSRKDLKEALGRAYGLFPLLKDREKQCAGTLSGGERQMLAMARALMLRPTLLLLDEPSAGLAPNPASRIFSNIEEIHATGISIMIVEQDARRSLSISHRGYVIAMGKNAFEDEAGKILTNEEIQKAYLGG